MNPANIIGYCGIVVPKQDFWQGYFIPSNEALSITMTAGCSAGALQASMVEAALISNHSVVAACALALRNITMTPYFYVLGHRGAEGYITEMHTLDVSSVDEARNAINGLSEVAIIKESLLAKMGGNDGMHRTFH